jgi:glycosyltransferase involved in cell wall biosynthesis
MDQRIPKSPPHISKLVNQNGPTWSVMIPAYNCIQYIEDTIRSVLVQDPGETSMQIEVVDDCSTDGNVEQIVNSIGKGRVKYHRHPSNIGSLRNFESCINRSKGTFIHILHADDKVEPGFYDEIFSLFQDHPTSGAAFTNYSYMDAGGQQLLTETKLPENRGIVNDLLYKLAKQQVIQPPAIVVKRSVYEEIGSFYAVHFGEDWEMWTRISSKYPVAYSPFKLATYRVGQYSGISFESFLAARNIHDIKIVIDIIQSYLPSEQRKAIKNHSLQVVSIHSLKVANGLLSYNRSAALKQAVHAYLLCPNLKTTFWFSRFLMMYVSYFKNLQKLYNSKFK